MENHKALVEWRELWLWIEWVLASALGGTVGGFLFANSFEVARWLLLPENLWDLLGEGVTAAVSWSIAGIAQWLLLRGRIRSPSRWVWASTAGSVIGVFVAVPVLFLSVSLIYTLMAVDAVAILWGVVTGIAGIAQWLFLRRRVFWAGWWVLATTVGGVLAAQVSWAMRDVAGRTLRGGTGAALAGAITGLLLVFLLRHPAPEGWNA